VIVPEVAGAAAPELDALRAGCDAAIARLIDSGARRVVVLGGDSSTREYFFPFRASFTPWGSALEVTMGDPDRAAEQPPLPLSLAVGAWLLRRRRPAGRPVSWDMFAVAPGTGVAECVRLGATFRSTDPWALLVMGDGSACRGEKSPGYDDPRAQPYDDAVAAALAGADADALLGLDPVVSAELKVAGRAPWQVLAGAVRAEGGAWRGDLSHYAAPYGVAYFVANWDPA
jgi:MYXO-CTERM domain-containing protein